MRPTEDVTVCVTCRATSQPLQSLRPDLIRAVGRFARSQAGRSFLNRKPDRQTEQPSRSLQVSRLAKLEEMLQQDPNDPFLNYAIAKELLSCGETESGLARLEEVIDAHPDYVPAYFQRGQSLYEDGETDQAREVIQAGIEVAARTGDQHAEMEMRGFLELL